MLGFNVIPNSRGILSLYSSSCIDLGGVILDLSIGEVCIDPSFRTIDLGSFHIDHPLGRYTNHSCNPNSYVDKEARKLIANKQILPGEEITFNYQDSEGSIVSPFLCSCGSVNCKGFIQK
jgi:hypothetical protein